MDGIIYYFTPCCQIYPPFGILNTASNAPDNWTWFNPNSGDGAYPLSIDDLKVCVTYSGSSLLPVGNYQVYTSTPTTAGIVSTDCAKCFDSYHDYTGCTTQPPVTPPPVISGHINECGVITILPMQVECVSVNPSSIQSSDGEVSVSITGGTPPYTISWSSSTNPTMGIHPALHNLPNGTYAATVVDYYKDFVVTVYCYIHSLELLNNNIDIIPLPITSPPPITNLDIVNTEIITFPVSINQPTCLCDGSILFNPTNLNNPPFTYSINNGVTYSNSPIFSNLCSGIYNLSILDSLDNNYSKTITLDKPTVATTYTLSLNTTQSTQINNPTTISKTYETTIIVTPELPDGTTVYFDIVHNNSFYSSPLSGTSILTTGTLLYKNEVPVSLSSTFSGDSTSVNTSPSCQSNTIYQFNTSDSWNSLSLTNSDIITISTSTRVDKTTLGLCSVGYSNESYSITNAIIKGCSCCEIINT